MPWWLWWLLLLQWLRSLRTNDMKCQMTWNVNWPEMSIDLKCQLTWNVYWPEMSIDLKCQLTWNDTWHMTHGTWHMSHDDILLNISNLYADADAISMTPSRNTRSYTLRSVPSSPGRSFSLLSILSPIEKVFFLCNFYFSHDFVTLTRTLVLIVLR